MKKATKALLVSIRKAKVAARRAGLLPTILCLGEKQCDIIFDDDEGDPIFPPKYAYGLRIIWTYEPDKIAIFEERPFCWKGLPSKR